MCGCFAREQGAVLRSKINGYYNQVKIILDVFVFLAVVNADNNLLYFLAGKLNFNKVNMGFREGALEHIFFRVKKITPQSSQIMVDRIVFFVAVVNSGIIFVLFFRLESILSSSHICGF